MNKNVHKPDFHKLCLSEQNPAAFLVSQMIFFFFLASFGGFLWEVLIFLIKDGQFRNRGFLYGPWLPVYGVGAVLFYLLLGKPLQRLSCSRKRLSGKVYDSEQSFSQNRLSDGAALVYSSECRKKLRPVAVFFLSMLIGTALELAIGWFLDTVWELRYWDYHGYFLNFRGYICLMSAVGFGIAGAIWVCFLSGLATKLWLKLPESVRSGANTLLILAFLVDCAAALIFPNIGIGITFSFKQQ